MKFTNEYLYVAIHTALKFPNPKRIEMRRIIKLFKLTHMCEAKLSRDTSRSSAHE